MILTAIVDRIENGNAILLSREIGVEISIPLNSLKDNCRQGELLTITIDKDGNLV